MLLEICGTKAPTLPQEACRLLELCDAEKAGKPCCCKNTQTPAQSCARAGTAACMQEERDGVTHLRAVAVHIHVIIVRGRSHRRGGALQCLQVIQLEPIGLLRQSLGRSLQRRQGSKVLKHPREHHLACADPALSF